MARIGEMIYGPGETPVPVGADGRTIIERTADVVFDPATMDSFVGQPITIKHPPGLVNTENRRDHDHGTILSARRGEGAFSDFMVGDILITTQEGIAAIENLKEVSCGYDAEFETISPGRGRQTKIVGNHLALVGRGRCGPSCYVGDQSMEVEDKTMSDVKPSATNLLRKLLGVKDDAEAVAILDKAQHDEDMAVLRAEIVTLKAENVRLTKDAEEKAKEDDDEDEDDKKKAKKKMADELPALHARVASAAEILSPGIKVATFDAAGDVQATFDHICACQKTALETASKTPAGKAAIDQITGGATLDALAIADMSAAFFAASALLGAGNNLALAGIMQGQSAQSAVQTNMDRSRAAQDAADKRWNRGAYAPELKH